MIKVASYAAGRRRVGALTDYLSRDGTLQVENQSGQKLTGRSVLDAELVTWENAFENRAPSKDVASLVIGVGAASDEQLAEGLKQAFAGRKFAWQRMEDEASSVRVVVILAGHLPDRQDWDAAATADDVLRPLSAACPPLQDLLRAMPAWRRWALCDRPSLTGAQHMARIEQGLAPLQQAHLKIIRAVEAVLPQGGIVASDMTQLAYSANYLMHTHGPRDTMRNSLLSPVGPGSCTGCMMRSASLA